MGQNKSVLLGKNGYSSASVCPAKIHTPSWNFRIAVTSFSGWSLSTSLLIELPCLFGMIFCNRVNNTKVHIQTPHLKESNCLNELSVSLSWNFLLGSLIKTGFTISYVRMLRITTDKRSKAILTKMVTGFKSKRDSWNPRNLFSQKVN